MRKSMSTQLTALNLTTKLVRRDQNSTPIDGIYTASISNDNRIIPDMMEGMI